MGVDPIPASISVRSPDARTIIFAVATCSVLLCWAVIYVFLPGIGVLASPPPSYGILIAIAVYFSAHVLCQPRLALLYAPLFILLATSVVPQSLVVFGDASPPPEYYFWALGLLFITAALAVRLPWAKPLANRKRWGIPSALVLFAAICVAASVQALLLGFSLSYVLRQFFGAALFVVYFYAALVLAVTRSDVARYFRLLKWFGVAVSLYAIACYASAMGDMGSFKWGLSTYCAMLAVYCFGEAAAAKTWHERFEAGVPALILIANPIVFQARSAAGIAALSGAVAFALLAKSGRAKTLLIVAIIGGAVAAITFNLIFSLNSFLPRVGNSGHLIPQSVTGDLDFIGRANQLLAALEVLKSHPLLGKGLGSTITYFDPNLGIVATVAMIDQGFAYLLSKLGLVGTACFALMVAAIFRRSGWPERNGLHIGLFGLFFFSVVYIVSHPMMLQFIGAGFAGILSGLLYRAPYLRAGPQHQAECGVRIQTRSG